MSNGRFSCKEGVVISEKLVSHDHVSGYIGNGSGSVTTETYEVQEFFLAYEGTDTREHFSVRGKFRVAVGDRLKVVFYDYHYAVSAASPTWITKAIQQQNGLRAVGYINLSTHRSHADRKMMPHADLFEQCHEKRYQGHLIWAGLLSLAGISYWFDYPTVAWITAAVGALVFWSQMWPVHLKDPEFRAVFNHYCDLDKQVAMRAAEPGLPQLTDPK